MAAAQVWIKWSARYEGENAVKRLSANDANPDIYCPMRGNCLDIAWVVIPRALENNKISVVTK
jgi:hypothetical protein